MGFPKFSTTVVTIALAAASGGAGYSYGKFERVTINLPTARGPKIVMGQAFSCRSLAYIAASAHPFEPHLEVTREVGSERYSMKFSSDGKALEFVSGLDVEVGSAQSAPSLVTVSKNPRFKLALFTDDSSAEVVLIDTEQRLGAVVFARPSLGQSVSFSGDFIKCY